MNIDNFLTVLNAIPSGHYISTDETNMYQIIADKGDKTINTQVMADLARDCFEEVWSSSDYDQQERDYWRLAQGLRAYSTRLFESKTWCQKIFAIIAAIFCWKSAEEKAIDTIMQSSYERYESMNKEFNLARNFIQNKTYLLPRQEESSIDRLKHYAQGVIETFATSFPTLQGMYSRYQAIFWYVQHLQKFYEQMDDSYTEEDQIFIQSLIAQYDFLLLVSSATAQSNPNFAPEYSCRSEYLYELVLQLIQDKLRVLQPGDRLVLPGGYAFGQEAAHAVIYSITKNSDNSFEFKVINTGEGIPLDRPIRDLGKYIFDVIKGKFNGQKSILHLTTSDILYDSIPLNSLDRNFFVKLLGYHVGSKPVGGMKNIHDFLDTSFSTHSSRQKGRQHKAQTSGSCTHKSISADAHDYLPNSLYYRFKAWMTEQEVTKLGQEFSFHKLHFSENGLTGADLQTLFDIGRQMVEKRKAKAETSL